MALTASSIDHQIGLTLFFIIKWYVVGCQAANDIQIRLPKQKKHLKPALVKLARENGLSFTQLVIFILEDFLRRRETGETLKVEP